MVSSQQIDSVFKLDLDGKYERQYFDGEAPSINIVTQEEILGWLEWSSSVVIDDLDEIVKLSMDVADDGYRILDLDHVGFLLYLR